MVSVRRAVRTRIFFLNVLSTARGLLVPFTVPAEGTGTDAVPVVNRENHDSSIAASNRPPNRILQIKWYTMSHKLHMLFFSSLGTCSGEIRRSR